MSFFKKGIIIIFSILLILTNSLTTFAGEPAPSDPPDVSKYMKNPEVDKPKLTVIESKPPVKTPPNKTPLSNAGVYGVLSTLFALTPQGEHLINKTAQTIESIDYAVYDYVHDSLAPELKDKLNSFSENYVAGTERILRLTEHELNSIFTPYEEMTRSIEFMRDVTPQNNMSQWNISDTLRYDNMPPIPPITPKIINSYWTYQFHGFVGMQEEVFAGAKRWKFWIWTYMEYDREFQGRFLYLYPNATGWMNNESACCFERIDISTANFKYKSEWPKIETTPVARNYWNATNGEFVFPSPSAMGNINTELPKVVEIDEKKYWEVETPNPDFDTNVAPDPLNNPETIPTLVPINDPLAEPIPEIIPNPDYVPETSPGTNPGTNPSPDPTNPGGSDGTNESDIPRQPRPEVMFLLLLAFLELLIAMVSYVVRLIEFMATIPLIPQMTINNEAFTWFKNAKIIGFPIYSIVMNLGFIGLSLSLYKIIQRVFMYR